MFEFHSKELSPISLSLFGIDVYEGVQFPTGLILKRPYTPTSRQRDILVLTDSYFEDEIQRTNDYWDWLTEKTLSGDIDALFEEQIRIGNVASGQAGTTKYRLVVYPADHF